MSSSASAMQLEKAKNSVNRTTRKKTPSRAIYTTSPTSAIIPRTDEETVILRLNVCARNIVDEQNTNHSVEPPDAYNASGSMAMIAPLSCDPVNDAMALTCSGSGTVNDSRHWDGNWGPGTTGPGPGPVTAPVVAQHPHPHPTPLKTLRVVQILADFDQKSRNSEWPSVTNVHCYWCCHQFDSPPIGLPMRRSGDIFHVVGCFCSLACAAAHNFGTPRVSVDRALERYSLLNSLAARLGAGGGAVKPAPDRLALAMFGGPMGINEFRAYGDTGRHVIINQPPMLTLTQQLEEVEERDMRSEYKYIPIDTVRVERFQEKVRLRRTRPLVDPKKTLDHCMNLRYSSTASSLV